jgi:hypothetical protein
MRPALHRGVLRWFAWVAVAVTGYVVFGLAVAHAAVPAGAQAEVDRTAAWLTRVLHRPIPTRTLDTQAASEMTVVCGGRPCTAYVPFSHPDRIVTTNPVVQALARIRRGLDGPDAGYVAIHELLHTRDLAPDEYGDGDIEEGVVDAVTLDVYPAWLHWRLPNHPAVWGPAYPRQVAAIRYASARATGSRTWKDRAARIWRRQLLEADAAGRQQMLTTAAGAQP